MPADLKLASFSMSLVACTALCDQHVSLMHLDVAHPDHPLTIKSALSPQFQSFSQYRCKTAKKSEEEIDFLRSNPKIWNVHSVLNVLHSLVDKSNINRQLEVYTSGGEIAG